MVGTETYGEAFPWEIVVDDSRYHKSKIRERILIFVEEKGDSKCQNLT